MNLIKRCLLVAVMASTSIAVNAEIIKTDFAVSGDNLVATDLETGIEWLSLTQNSGLSILDVEALLPTIYSGWRLASRSEVNVMFSHLTGYDFVTNGTYTFGGYNSGTKASTYNVLNNFGYLNANYTRGLYRDVDGTVMMSGAYVKNSSNTLNYMYDDHTAPSYVESFSAVDYSVFLVSDGGASLGSLNDPSLNANNTSASASASVPLPASIGLLSLAMLGFSARRKTK